MASVERSSLEHQRLVGELIDWIKQEGFVVKCASYDEYPPCDEWKEETDEHVPDARGVRYVPDGRRRGEMNPDLLCLGEAKTAEDIDNDHTKAQFKEFSNYVMPGVYGQDCPFYVAISKGSEETLERVLKELGLPNKPHVKWRSF